MADQSLAIAHKDYDVRGGGELLAEELARTFDAPLYVGRRDPDNEPDDFGSILREIDLTRWQRWAIRRGGAARSLAYWIAWQNADELADYDVLITSGNEPLWHVGPDTQVKIAYTHSTPRWQYDLAHTTGNGTIGTVYQTAVRTIYQHNVTRPDLFVANSDLVARRIRKYWNVPRHQIRVVYPPTRTHEYSPDDALTGEYYLHLGRLAGHKRVGDVVEVMEDIDDPLLIAGRGPERDRLERIAPDNVEFLGYVSEEGKRELLAGAKALLYPPRNEDFGMVPIEAMAAGTPVIGVNEGFTRFQITAEKNGYLVDRGDGAWVAAIRQFERDGVEWADHEIAAFAERFSVGQFREGMRHAVAEAVDRGGVDVPWGKQDQPEIAAGVQTAADLIADGEG